jgi:hypothetical protein
MGAFGRWLGGLLQQGDVVAATDYQGLGTPGLARAAIGLSAGRAVLDAARAARGLDAGASGRVVLDGHSEGGHAVLWAAEPAGAYAPELQVLGVAASAPGAELAPVRSGPQRAPAERRRPGRLRGDMSLMAPVVHGMQEARGSNPSIPITAKPHRRGASSASAPVSDRRRHEWTAR